MGYIGDRLTCTSVRPQAPEPPQGLGPSGSSLRAGLGSSTDLQMLAWKPGLRKFSLGVVLGPVLQPILVRNGRG